VRNDSDRKNDKVKRFMGSKNGHRKDPLNDVDIEAISAEEPDVAMFEIILQVMFYEPIKQEEGVMEQLELTGEEIAKMLHQFKAGGFSQVIAALCGTPG